MLLFLVIIIPAIILTLRWLIVRFNLFPHTSVFRIVFILNILSLLVYITSLILGTYDLYFKGHRSGALILITTCIFTIVSFLCYPKKTDTLVYLLGCFACLQALVGAFLLVDVTDSYKKEIIYNSNHSRLVLKRYPFGPSELQLFEKRRLIERKYNLTTYRDNFFLAYSVDSFRIQEKPGRVEINIYHHDSSYPSPVVEVVKTID